jgi:hypothetical protein
VSNERLFVVKYCKKKKYCKTRQLLSKITKQVKKPMPTYNEEFLENLLSLEKSEMSDKNEKKKILRGSYQPP